MPDALSHADQYKMLREEILQAIRETFRSELWTAGATGLLYAWLIQHKQQGVAPALWFIGPVIVLVCGVRCLAMYLYMRRISAYFKKIEEEAFGNNTALPGWERYSDQGARVPSIITAVAIWILMFGLAVLGSWTLSH